MSVPFSESVTFTRVLDSRNYTQQDPTGEGINNAIAVRFGTEEASSDGGIKVYNDGSIELLDNKYEYHAEVYVNMGRQSASGVIDLYAWAELAVDGVNFIQLPDSNTLHIALDDTTVITREQASIVIPRSLPVGAKMRFMFGRGVGGANQGSLYAHLPTGDFNVLNPTPSATLRISKYEAP